MIPDSPVLTISGIRDIATADVAIIEMEMASLLSRPRAEIRFGGARGTDTVALHAACCMNVQHTRLAVVVPSTVDQQPREAREVIRCCATTVQEMGLSPRDPRSYHARNLRMLEGSGGLLAFWDGGPGGTAFTIQAADRMKLPIEVVRLTGRTAGGRPFPPSRFLPAA